MKKSFILHLDSLDVLDELSPEQVKELMIAIRNYNKGFEPELSGLMKAIFIPFKNQFIRDNESYQNIVNRNKSNGSKGGRPKTQQNPENPVGFLETQITQVNPSKPKKPDSDSDSDSDSVNDNDNDNEKELILTNKSIKTEKAKKIRKSKNEGLHSFADSPYFDLNEFKKKIDIQYHKYDIKFYHQSAVDYSASSGKKYLDWVAAIRSWINNDAKEGKAKMNTSGNGQVNKGIVPLR